MIQFLTHPNIDCVTSFAAAAAFEGHRHTLIPVEIH